MSATNAMTKAEAHALTVPQRLLASAYRLEAAGHRPFRTNALVVAAWTDAPATFGLEEFAERYPDSNRVLAGLMGDRGLVGRGWFEKVAEKTYQLTRRGLTEARRIAESNGHAARAPLGRVRVPADLDEYLTALFESEAYKRWVCGREVRSAEALAFWGCTAKDGPELVRFGMVQVADRLAAAKDYAGVSLACGLEVSDAFLERLGRCHAALAARFGRRVSA